MKISLWGWLVILLTGMPLLTLMLLGILWLWQADRFLEWLLILVLLPAAGLLLFRFCADNAPSAVLNKTNVKANPLWPDHNLSAWQHVVNIAENIELSDSDIEDHNDLLALGERTINAVAEHFHPESKEAVFEIALPYLLLIIERVSQDLRRTLNDIPFSHILTIHDLIRGRDLAAFASKVYNAYRIATAAINPVEALLRELRTAATQGIVRYPAKEVKLWLLRSYVKKVGYYAIELYSGGLQLSDTPTERYISRYSDTERSNAVASGTAEPLRLLVIGQVNAGKSSVINALFGEQRAATDVITTTSEITPYMLERDGIGQMLILDTVGYSSSASDSPPSTTELELLRSDLVLLVCTATTAAREADRILLERLITLFRRQPKRVAPPVTIILTHIDHLRPRGEWSPPYDISQPKEAKAKNIRLAIEAVALDLDVDITEVIPVCLNPEQKYNVEEVLIPTILSKLDAARKARFIRCLREQQSEDYWVRLLNQAKNSGTLLLKAGLRITEGYFDKH